MPFDESEHPRSEGGKFAAAVAGGAAGLAATAALGVGAIAEIHRRARVRGIEAYRAASRGKKVVFRGSKEPHIAPQINRYGAIYVANNRKTAKGFAYDGVVNRYALDPSANIALPKSREAAKIFAARQPTSAEPDAYDHALRRMEGDVFRTNADISPKGEGFKRLHEQRINGEIYSGRGSFWSLDDGQRKVAANLGVHGVAAPEWRRGDASALFHPEHLTFIGSGPKTRTIGMAEKVGSVALKLVRSLHKKAPFEESKHPRDDAGHFAQVARTQRVYEAHKLVQAKRAKSLDHQADVMLRNAPPSVEQDSAPHPRPVAPVETAPRSLARASSAWSTGSKIAEIPAGYTGSTAREPTAEPSTNPVVKWQRPKAVSKDDHRALLHGLAGTIQNNRDGAIVRAHIRGLIPAGTETRSIHRAYNHASMLAMHDYGVLDYDFKMDDPIKSEMKPLEPFIQYSRRRVIDQMRLVHKGKWQPYRQEFGTPFADNRKNKRTGEVRLRTRSNMVLVKAFEEDKHARSSSGEFSSEGAKEKSDLVQPAQIIGGAFGASAATIAAGALAEKHIKRLSTTIGRRAGAGIRLSARTAGVMKDNLSFNLIRNQAKLGGHFLGGGSKVLLGAGVGLAAGLAGDFLGDKGARIATGKTGAEDEYRHASIVGMMAGMAGMALGHTTVGSRLWRPLRYSGVRRGLAGLAAAVVGSVGAEVAGNLIDERVHATDMLAGVNRRTTARFAEEGQKKLTKRVLGPAELKSRRAYARWQKAGA